MKRKERNILLLIMGVSIISLGLLYSPICSPNDYKIDSYTFKTGVDMNLAYVTPYTSKPHKVDVMDVVNTTDNNFNYAIQVIELNDNKLNVLNQEVAFQESSFIKKSQIVLNKSEMLTSVSLSKHKIKNNKSEAKYGFESISTIIDDTNDRFLSNEKSNDSGNNGNGNGHDDHGNGNGNGHDNDNDDCDDDENPIPVGDMFIYKSDLKLLKII